MVGVKFNMEGCCNNMNIVSSGTPQGGLGQLDVITGIFDFASGLFSKDPQKVEYDRIRQQVWDSIVQLVEEHENHKAAGSMSRSFLQHLIEAMDTLLAGFKKYTDGMLVKYPGDADWINPRFHDYYDFGIDIKNAWQQEIATLPADYTGTVVDYIQDLFGSNNDPDIQLPTFPNTTPINPDTGLPIRQASMSSTSMLLIGGVVIGAVLLATKGRR